MPYRFASATRHSASTSPRSTWRPSSLSIDVARAATSGGYAARRMLMPKPSTTWSTAPADEPASARMPASLREPTYTSFGHLTHVSSPDAASTPSAIATPAAIVSNRSAGPAGRSTTETYSPAPGGDDQLRPTRPRPRDWAFAATTKPSRMPASAAPMAMSLVEPTSSCQERRVPNGPSRDPARPSASVISDGAFFVTNPGGAEGTEKFFFKKT